MAIVKTRGLLLAWCTISWPVYAAAPTSQPSSSNLAMEISPTPLVLKSEQGPRRRIDIRILRAGKPQAMAGTITVSVDGQDQSSTIAPTDCVEGAYSLLLPEPTSPIRLRVTFRGASDHPLESDCDLKPARHWTFYMTPHTHFDVGFTRPQPEVIEQVTHDMDAAVHFCEQTVDWPAESRYRWTIEVTSLLRYYIERHAKPDVDRLLRLIREGRIEVCGFNFNMPTELTGHEELIRCLYDVRRLRESYRIPIDTVMIDDVPGYTWALPQLLSEAGLSRASFRANPIRGQFIWHRPRAVPRPCYWQSPDGSRVFMWYTDSYREGNFFRSPGSNEREFLRIIQQNEQAGTWVDDIQLRMGGDNLPPDLNTSSNARAWNAKYLWPRVTVATNREFLETIERTYGSSCQTVRGDIPSWWADGPASSAAETGMNRLTHDRLVTAEALWTRLWLERPDVDYPGETLAEAYDRMCLFDEHTWGSRDSVRQPEGRDTLEQWRWKSSNAYAAREMTDNLCKRALAELSTDIGAAVLPAVAVWNTLAWPRSDVVRVSLTGSPLHGAAGLRVTDTRTGRTVPVQTSPDRTEAFFVAEDVPGIGCAVYTISRASPDAPTASRPAATRGTLESRFYRLTAASRRNGIASWYDKISGRELLDRISEYAGDEPLHETPIGGREAIDRKQPVRFERTQAAEGRLIEQFAGPVYEQMTLQTSLPAAPRILQTFSVYADLPVIDIENELTKDANLNPEAIYFAFPFNFRSAMFDVMIADAAMRPGKDQLPFSCHDFYSIQHWLHVGDNTNGVTMASLEAPLVVLGGLQTYSWADRTVFDTGQVFSFALNNYWMTNFKASQSGRITLRYRLTSTTSPHDRAAATRFGMGPFHPLTVVWLSGTGRRQAGGPLIEMSGDAAVISCVKLSEDGKAIILRLLEMRGHPCRCSLRLNSVKHGKLTGAFRASILEQPISPLAVRDNVVTVELRANEIATIGLTPAPR